jgi:hypothetical protein
VDLTEEERGAHHALGEVRRRGGGDGGECRLPGLLDQIGVQQRRRLVDERIDPCRNVGGTPTGEGGRGVGEVDRGVLVGEPRLADGGRLKAGPHGELAGAGGEAVHGVMGDLGGGEPEARSGGRGKSGRRRGVDSCAPCGVDLVGEGVGDEGVRETEPTVVFGEQAGVEPWRQRVEHLGRAELGDGRDHGDVEGPTDDGGHREQLLGHHRQVGDPPPDHELDTGWDGSCRPDRVRVRQPALGREEIDQLLHEQRVPTRAVVHHLGDLHRHVDVGAAGEPVGEGRSVQAVQLDVNASASTGHLTEAVDERVRRVLLQRSGRDGEERLRGVEIGGDVLQQPQRRRIGPLQIVDHQQYRHRRRRQRRENRPPQLETGRSRVVDVLGHRRQIDERPCDDAPRLQLLAEIDDRPERRCGGPFGTMRPRHREPRGVGVQPQLVEEAGLPDARLSDDDGDAAVSGGCSRQHVREVRQLVLPTDERRAGRGWRRCRRVARGSRWLPIKGGRVGEEVGFQPAQVGARVEARGVGECPTAPPDGAEGVGLPARSVQGDGEQAVEPLVERMLPGLGFEEGEGAVVVADGETRLGRGLDRRRPGAGEASRGIDDERLLSQFR